MVDGIYNLSLKPVLDNLDNLKQFKISEIHVGKDSYFFKEYGGGLYAWGRNDDGQLGLGSFDKLVPIPVEVDRKYFKQK